MLKVYLYGQDLGALYLKKRGETVVGLFNKTKPFRLKLKPIEIILNSSILLQKFVIG